MAGLSILLYRRQGEDLPLVDRELRDLANKGRLPAKDAGRLRAVLELCWRLQGFSCSQLDYRPIKGKPYEDKLWEARWLKSARSDGVHGYRIFYMLTRKPKVGIESATNARQQGTTSDGSEAEQVVILLMLFEKSGKETPQSVLQEAWKRYQEVERLINDKKMFKPGETYAAPLQ